MTYGRSRSIVYRAEQSGSGKWIFALIVFLAVMMIAWAEVDGINIPPVKKDTTHVDQNAVHSSAPSGDLPAATPQDGPKDSSPIPEPTTILLLGAGVGAAYLMRRRKV